MELALSEAGEDHPTEPASDTAFSRPSPPERIGPYLPRTVLGEGGMGIVWEAEQEEPIRRRVALKCIRVGMDGGHQFQARFESERQALALMGHPNIARAYDARSPAHGVRSFPHAPVGGPRTTRHP